MSTQQQVLDFYSHPTAMTFAGKHAALLNQLPNNIGQLTHIIQGLILYEYAAFDFYSFTIPEKRKYETHLRSIEDMLDALLVINDRPLFVNRPVNQRLIGICHHFSLLLVSILRTKEIPARYRCGFGSYFNPPYYEEHVVCEYWNTPEMRWIIVDPQFDETWQEKLGIDHNILDVPHDRFITASNAWLHCRSGAADPSKFGIFKGDLRGLWFIAGEIIRDVAALNKMEMLPWDIWGAIPHCNELLNQEQLAFFDELAALTQSPDTSLSELQERYKSDSRLRVPATVFNGVLNCLEII